MANSAPPVQDYMLKLAAVRLTPEKFALLQYKLATGSPAAMNIMDAIKPGEWERAVGNTREFNDIKSRLEAAIDAWVHSDPTSKGFLWPPQAIKLNLDEAAAKLSKLTTDSTSPVSIIRAGAAGKIPVHWFNDLKISTKISNFKGDLPYTEICGPVQLEPLSLRALAVSQSTEVMDFKLSDQDFDLLGNMKGSIIDKDDNLLVYRHPATKDGTVNISRDQLFVYGHDLQAYAATLAPATVAVSMPTAKAADVGKEQTQSASGNVGLSQSTVLKSSKNKKQPNAITELIRKAMFSTASAVPDVVWVALREMAKDGYPPFTGGVEDSDNNEKAKRGSLLYNNTNNDVVGFTKAMCKDRIRNINNSPNKSV